MFQKRGMVGLPTTDKEERKVHLILEGKKKTPTGHPWNFEFGGEGEKKRGG